MNKPNGQFLLAARRDAVLSFVAPLSVRKIPGIGKVSAKELAGLGITTGSDLASVAKACTLIHLFSKDKSDGLIRAGLGLGPTHAGVREPRKGISCERTFGAQGLAGSALEARLHEIATTLARHMAEETPPLRAKHMTVKMKRVDFQIVSRSKTLP